MHRTIEISVAAGATDGLLRELEQLEEVIGLSVMRGGSLKPLGDVISVHTLNRGADEVLRRAGAAQKYGPMSAVTHELASIIDPKHQRVVDNDVDEAIWEEMEAGLRHQGRITPNYLILMALGGAIATIGLVTEGTSQAIALVAASIIAPGFEPIAKLPLGLALRRWNVVQRGLVSAAVGYVVLMLAAAAAFVLLRLAGTVGVEQLAASAEVHRIAHPTFTDIVLSAAAAVSGVTMIMAYRRSVIAGPLVALALIPAAATSGAGIVAGRPSLFYEGLERLAVDAVLIIVLGTLVLLAKQATVHRRATLV